MNVHCRTGSLEMEKTVNACQSFVHCRTGSLENHKKRVKGTGLVHCRTGSLEMLTIGTTS